MRKIKGWDDIWGEEGNEKRFCLAKGKILQCKSWQVMWKVRSRSLDKKWILLKDGCT